jgi:hypothetical protein
VGRATEARMTADVADVEVILVPEEDRDVNPAA